MPAFLNWLLRLLPTNPICMRLVQGGSRRLRHLYLRAGYLAVMIVVLLMVLLSAIGGGTLSLRQLAGAGAQMFNVVSYLQVGLICLLTPVFMAGAIAQEANPRTWDILLTTPLNSLQVVLGNLFGRLFFVIALLFSSLPLFVMTQYFGGVSGGSIFASYAIAGTSALIVASIAVTLSVTRTAGRRAVFLFYASVVMYLVLSVAADYGLRVPVAVGAAERHTTFFTPLNPFLALQVLLDSNRYVPYAFTTEEAGWLRRMWFGRPIATFCWLCAGASFFLICLSTLRLRVIGARVGSVPWYRRLFGLSAKGATERPPRPVGKNAIAWRESVARGKTLGAMLTRWSFIGLGLVVGVAVIALFHVGNLSPVSFRLALGSVLGAEIMIIALAALNLSATAVSREREDGSLDIILTTPIQPGPYLLGKLRGLVQYLAPMMMVPVVTLAVASLYVMLNGLGQGNVTMTSAALAGHSGSVDIPVLLPEGALALPVMLAPFVAFCVMVGLQWSIRSKGTIGSMIAAVGIVLAIVGVVSLCAMPAGRNLSFLGTVMSTFSPINMLFAVVYPESTISGGLSDGTTTARVCLIIGAAIAAVIYSAIAYGMYTNSRRTFMMTVRRLAGTS